MALSTQIRAAISATQSGDLDLTDPSAVHALSVLESLADGTTNVQADRIFSDTRTLAASATEDLDFGSGGGLTDAFGTAFSPAEIVCVFIVAAEANTNNVIVGAAAAEPFLGPMGGTTPTETIKPGGFLFWFSPAGWTVTNNSNDKLKIANSAGSTGVDYSIVVVARSA
jgi:hypothetical protein